MSERILTAAQVEKLTAAFIAGRQRTTGIEPSVDEIESLLLWFNEVARGALLTSGVLSGVLLVEMQGQVISFLERNQDQVISSVIEEQIEELFEDREW